MLRRWSKPALGLVYSLGRIDSGEFVTVLVGHALRSLSLGGIVFYSNIIRAANVRAEVIGADIRAATQRSLSTTVSVQLNLM